MNEFQFVARESDSISKCLVVLMFATTLISSWAIYASDTTLSGETVQVILRIVVYMCVLACSFLLFLKNLNKLYVPIAIIIPFVYTFLIYLDNYAESSFNGLLLIELICFFMLEDAEKLKLYLWFKKYLYITAVIGIFIYLCHSVGIPLPHSTVQYYASNAIYTSAVYQNYGLAYLSSLGGVTRLCGLFNEPGYFGTILALVLCVEKLDLKKKENVAFLIAGCCSASVAFFVIVALYVILAKVQNFKYMVVLAIFILALYIILPYIQFSNTTLLHLVDRLKFEDGQLVGDNRTNTIIDYFYYSVLTSPQKILWGYGKGFVASLKTVCSTYKSYVIDFGLVGFTFIYLPPIMEGLRMSRFKREIVIFIICFVASIYQRPNIYTLPYLVVFYGGIVYLNSRRNLSDMRKNVS